jgi:CheY-like chemotaxis protein
MEPEEIEQLIETEKAKAVRDITSGVAHDLNNMLTVILGYARMIQEEVDDRNPQFSRVREVTTAATRASVLTRQLVGLTRPVSYRPAALSLRESVDRVSPFLQHVVSRRVKIELREDEQALDLIHADPARTELLLLLLALQARDAMPKGGQWFLRIGALEIADEFASLCLSAPQGQYVELSSSDTGKTQLDAGGERMTAIRTLTEQAKGHVRIHSAAELGTSIRLLFPAADRAPTEKRSTAQEEALLRGTGTVLLVEDEIGLRRLVRTVLERAGYHVLDAASASDALEIERLRQGPIDLLLTDIMMPGMNGNELSNAFAERRPGTPVLRMSAYAKPDLEHSERSPFLQKPFTAPELLRTVAEVLTRH